jgi:transposase InsO family protein
MSKARLIITAVVLEGRSQSTVARDYGVSKGWVSKLVARYRAEGDAAFEPRSRRPKTTPTAIDELTVELIVELREQLVAEGLDAGPDTIHWHLEHHHATTVSVSTIARTLTRAGLVTPEPKKRPRSSYIRFEADQPNECWQSDFTHYPLADGTDTEILSWLDDHSRYALRITAHQPVTGPIVLNTFRAAGTEHGYPASTLTDNGLVYTARFAGGRGGRNGFEAELVRLGIVQKNSRPNHPTTCGKVERFQQTLKRWLDQQPTPTTLEELQALLDAFRAIYNQQRPHRSLPRRATPATIYTTRPKASPTNRTDPHYRVRRDRIDDSGVVTLRVAGQLHHIGIGRTLARTHVILLVDDLDVRVVDAATGELLRALTIDTNRDYQPTGAPKGPTRPKKKRPEPS